ncbi:MAG: chromosomal replication initiator protein DnaA [Candidatus Andersenbacteria bacterium]|nr:chromosomal replication initiator protein DnaA [Candidatus Andersenbacteria bacterium]MBI3250763.1 chromosomal replication initiator protein DnaA [Candidatus Andersenbacteria bacterium]
MTNDQLWKAALGQLELRVSPGNFLTWFRSTRAKERKRSTLVVETQNPFAYEWLSRKYRSLILEVLKDLDQSITDIKIMATPKNHAAASQRRNLRIVAHKQKVTRPSLTTPTRQVTTGQSSVIALNEKYTFESFVVGASNEIAYAACRAVADKPGAAYNPLFIYGGVGLGKTHLLQAIGTTILARNPNSRILYVASEKFMNDFVRSLREKATQKFKDFYRNADVLIVDDIQILAGKEKTQEELFYTYNSLHQQNKQLIISSDRPPSAIPAFQERLSSRLAAGMIVDVKKPDFETRLAILEEKSKHTSITIHGDALTFIAKNIQSNVRDLEGALNRVIGHAEIRKQEVTVEYAKETLQDILTQSQHKAVDTKQIIQTVSTYYNLTSDEICGKRRNKEIVRPRQIAMYLLRKENNMSYPSIGNYFGGRDHTTAMHACEKIEKLIERDEELSQEINFLRERLYA